VTRVAAVDLGTNSTRLLVADVRDEQVDELLRDAVVTRLGEGVDADRRLRPEAAARVHAVLARYRGEADRLGATQSLAVATSAVRDAANGPAFLAAVEREHGFATRLLSGGEEAELTLLGAGVTDEGTLLIDIGGGSTELVAGSFRASLDIGSVRLTERFLHGDPPEPAELRSAAELVRSLLPDLRPSAAVGVAGTVAQLRLLLGRLTPDAVERELARLAALSLAERRQVPGLEPERAYAIVAGALIVAECLRRYALAELRYSVRDLLDGAAIVAAAVHPLDRREES
jgi:exopolyphosphatase / guanosine-5'-triphosphate,3'-diphosphate pyrophosphatase